MWCSLSERGADEYCTTGDDCREMQLFYAFNSTQVWHFNAFVVGNKRQKKTFAGVMYDEQKNFISLHDNSTSATIRVDTCIFLMFCAIKVPYSRKSKRDHKERCAGSIFGGNKF